MESNANVNTQFSIAKIPHLLKLRSLETSLLNPSIEVSFANENYEVKTATTTEEFIQALSLRFEVFFREFSSTKVGFTLFPYDVDVHDFACDHLIVKDKKLNRVIACYRLRASNHSNKFLSFYSESEFKISELVNSNENKLELGRACVHKDYRNGSVISMLWKGMLDYAKQANTRYMFGCSSVARKDFASVPQILRHLEKNNSFINQFEIGVQPKYELWFKLEDSNDEYQKRPMNSLMHMYLMAGAKIGRNLAYDAEMDCIDMFTLMDLRELPQSFARKFA